MLTVAAMDELLAGVQYKPGWLLRVYEGAFEGPHLRVTATVPNAYQPDETVELDVWSPIPPLSGVRAFDRWLAWRLCRVESHECREWLRRDNQPIFDPHGSHADRDLWP